MAALFRARAGALVIVAVIAGGASVVARRPPAPAIDESSVRAHMEMLASDALRGRGSGTRDEWLAATYVASEMRRAGLEPLGDAGGFIQEIPTSIAEVAGPPIVSIDGEPLVHGRDLIVLRLGAAHVSGPLVHAVAGVDPPAGAVLLLSGTSAPSRQALARAAAILEPDDPGTPADWSAPPPSPTDAAAPWRVRLGPRALARVQRAADGATIALDADLRPGRTWNVLARLPGSDARHAADVVMLSAHLDHLGVRGDGPDRIYNGADDDASGTTAVIELAQAMAAGPRPERTMLFVLFGSEEDGELGSGHFEAHPPVPLTSIVADVAFEMIGRPDPAVPAGHVWLTGFERTTLGPALAKHGAPIVADPRPQEQFFERSDNFSLARQGVVAQTISTYGMHPEYHTPADDLAHIDFGHLAQVIQSLVAPIRWLADSAFVPAWTPGGRPAPDGR